MRDYVTVKDEFLSVLVKNLRQRMGLLKVVRTQDVQRSPPGFEAESLSQYRNGLPGSVMMSQEARFLRHPLRFSFVSLSFASRSA